MYVTLIPNDERGIALIKGGAQRNSAGHDRALCPECGWVNLWILRGHSLHCTACGWVGDAEDVFIESEVEGYDRDWDLGGWKLDRAMREAGIRGGENDDRLDDAIHNLRGLLADDEIVAQREP